MSAFNGEKWAGPLGGNNGGRRGGCCNGKGGFIGGDCCNGRGGTTGVSGAIDGGDWGGRGAVNLTSRTTTRAGKENDYTKKGKKKRQSYECNIEN